MATHRRMQSSIHLSGKTAQIVHKMLQDMMLGTLEKNRVQEFEEQHSAKLKPTNKAKKMGLIEDFLKARLEGKVDKLGDERDELKKNPHKYDIYEERDFITLSEPESSYRKVNNTATQEVTTVAMQEAATAAIGFRKRHSLNLNVGESGNNSINDEVPEKVNSASKVYGYYTSKKMKPQPHEYEEY